MYNKKYFAFGLCLIIFFTIFSSPCFAEEAGNAMRDSLAEISLCAIKTDNDNGAIGFRVNYKGGNYTNYLLRNVEKEGTRLGPGWIMDISPDIYAQAGNEDAFNSVIVKITGNYVHFKSDISTTGIAADAKMPYYLFPASIGFETNQRMDTVNLVAEMGYIPLGSAMGPFKLGQNPILGLFVQTGYKFEINDRYDNTADPETGGARDRSEEDTGNMLLRLKLAAKIKIDLMKFSGGKRMVSLIPDAKLWFDVANSEIYHRLNADLRLALGQGKYFDIVYENGSGAPNFNEGQQLSLNFTLAF